MGAQSHATIDVRRTGPVLRIALARPQVRNAFDATLIEELTGVLEEASGDPDLRALVLTGQGPTFCAGADLNWMRAAADLTPEQNAEDARRLARLFEQLAGLPFPSLCGVQGAALGGGTGLVACVDVVLAEPGARFGFTEVRLGIIPAVISPFVLRKISRGDALRWFQTGELFQGEEALRMGLVSEVVEPDRLQARLDEVLESILSCGPRAVRDAKRLIDEVLETPPSRRSELTAQRIATVRAREEAREGMSAFLEKRAPRWRARPE